MQEQLFTGVSRVLFRISGAPVRAEIRISGSLYPGQIRAAYNGRVQLQRHGNILVVDCQSSPRHVKVERTGAAEASGPGSIANTGYLNTSDIHPDEYTFMSPQIGTLIAAAPAWNLRRAVVVVNIPPGGQYATA